MNKKPRACQPAPGLRRRLVYGGAENGEHCRKMDPEPLSSYYTETPSSLLCCRFGEPGGLLMLSLVPVQLSDTRLREATLWPVRFPSTH